MVQRVHPLNAYASLYSFQARPDGRNPTVRLIPFDGYLVGTTSNGGRGCPQNGCGTIFKITKDGKETILHRFQGIPDGANPLSELATASQVLYGTTNQGGMRCAQGATGCGTVFSTNSSGEEVVLHKFAGVPDGANPQGPLTLARGLLYGTTTSGGAKCTQTHDGCGTVFSINAQGAESVLYSFKGTPDAQTPTGNLIYLNGTLYGTTVHGGPYNYGTVFSITPAGSEHILYSGKSPGDLKNPAGLVAMNGVLYGTGEGEFGEALLYRLTTAGRIHIVHLFDATGRNGADPTGRLIAVGGLLYGTTQYGGEKGNGYGLLYVLSPSGFFRVLYRFKGAPDGAYPAAGVTDAKGNLYGTTDGGGSGCHRDDCGIGYGTVFRFLRKP